MSIRIGRCKNDDSSEAAANTENPSKIDVPIYCTLKCARRFCCQQRSSC